LNAADGSRLILVATMSNLVFKTAIIAALRHKELLLKAALMFIAALLVGIGLLLFV
jgi:uncharacterized membrane protein (DUF4010 family)